MAWGGFRSNSGRRKKNGDPPAPAQPRAQPAQPVARAPDYAELVAVLQAMEQNAKQRKRTLEWCPYRVEGKVPRAYIHPARMMPEDKKMRMAYDEDLVANNAFIQNQWLTGGVLSAVESEGLFFLGYPLLSEMAQRSEFRTISETIATEMTRKAWRWKATGQGDDEEKRDKDKDPAAAKRLAGAKKPNGPASRASKLGDDDKGDKIREMRDLERHLGLVDAFSDAAFYDGTMGRSHLYLDCGDAKDDLLKTPLVDLNVMMDPKAMKEALTAVVGPGWLKRVANVEPIWVYPTTYNANNPLSTEWYNPQVWYVMGREIHRSRIPTFIGRPVPDLLKPAYSFGGLSLSQLAKPYVDIWIKTRQSTSDLVQSYATMVFLTDLSTLLMPNNMANLAARVAAFTMFRDNQGVFVGNKDKEDIKSVAHPIAGLGELQQQSLEHIMIPSRIPAVKFTGMQPSGLNASSEGELQAWDETCGAYQKKLFGPKLDYVGWIMQLSLWGEIDDDISHEFIPLRSMSEKEEAELDKMKAETASVRIGDGLISQEEERQRLADDPKSPYPDIDPDDLPEPPDMGEGIDPEAAVKVGGVKGGFGAQKGGGGPGKPPFGGAGDLALDAAFIPLLEEAERHDLLGYLDGLTKISCVPDADQWNASYTPATDEITIEGKLEDLPLAQQLEVLVHEAGHRGGLKVDRKCFREFKRRGFHELPDFLAIANKTHLRDFERRGVVDGLTQELFAQSYAKFCLGGSLPQEVAQFWRQRAAGLATDEAPPAAAGVAFVTPLNHALFLRWAPGHARGGEWAFPGGGLEARERPRDAALRETAEETGWKLSEDDYVRLLNHNADHGADYWTYVHPIENEFEPQLSDEHDRYEWRPLADPPEPLHPGVEHLLRAGYMASDEFREADHPRGQPGNAGQFGPGGGGEGGQKHKFEKGAVIRSKSGNLYKVERQRSDPHHKLQGEIGYSVVGLRNGKPFGPVRLMRESAFTGPAPSGGLSASELFKEHANPNASVADVMAKLPPEAAGKMRQVEDRIAAGVSTDAPVDKGGFMQADGTYTEERQAIHKNIIADILNAEAIARATPAQGEKPVMTMLGGRGGSGKSWLTGDKGPVDGSKTIVIDADHIKSQLPGFEGWNAAHYHEESSYVLDQVEAVALQMGINVTYDVTMKSEGGVVRRMASHIAAGYEVKGYYMFLPPEMAAERAASRWWKGGKANGRFVPPAIVLSNQKNEENFDKVKEQMSEWKIYSNMTAAGPRLESEGGGK